MATTTLLAHLGPQGTDLPRLVSGIDGQSLPYDAFDVVFLLDAADHAQRERLEALVACRPNMQVVVGAADLGELASGEWLVYLAPEVLGRAVQLRPRALELLTAAAERADADLVLGRTDAAGHVLDLFAGNGAEIAAATLLGPFAVAYRRAFAAAHGLARDAGSAGQVLAAAARTAAFGDYPCLTSAERPDPVSTDTLTQSSVGAEWVEGRVRVHLEGTARGAGELRFAVRNLEGDQFWLADSRAVTAGEPFAAIVELDVCTAALGEPLPAGVWQLQASVHSTGATWAPQQPVRAARLGPALLGTTFVAPVRGDVLALDVGATGTSAVPRFAATDVRIRETATGTLMTVPLPGLHTVSDAVVSGDLLLDTFRLHAQISVEDGAATLRCLLSGLAGTAKLATRFGSGRPARTGLELDISPTGQMAVRRAVKPSAKQQQTGPNASEPFVVRMRRRVPPRLKKSLSRNQTARRLYERLARR
jgi:hypothetical protein